MAQWIKQCGCPWGDWKGSWGGDRGMGESMGTEERQRKQNT